VKERNALANGIESRADAIASFMAAWLEADACGPPGDRALPTRLEPACRAVVHDFIVWLRDPDGLTRSGLAGDAWWSLGSYRARQLACSSVHEYLRSADDLTLEALGRSPMTPDLLYEYFLPAGPSPLPADSRNRTTST
jgi:hypothetical protein